MIYRNRVTEGTILIIIFVNDLKGQHLSVDWQHYIVVRE